MPVALVPDIVVYVCTNCIPQSERLPRQWNHEGARVLVREVPCTGKMDGQYLCHAIEGGLRGVCVVACPKGDCHLAQGNYRAEVRIRTLQRLLGEVGLEAERAGLLHVSPGGPPGQFASLVRGAVARIAALGESPLRGTKAGDG